MHFIFRKSGGAVGDIATHIGDILGRCVPDVLSKARCLLEPRFGPREVQEKSFVRVGVEVPRANDNSAQSTQGECTEGPRLIPTSPELRAARQHPLSLGAMEVCQNKLGEL